MFAGTPGGTVFVRTLFKGLESTQPAHLTNVNGTLFFSADDPLAGTELWKSDGAGNTVRVADIYAGIGNATPAELTEVAENAARASFLPAPAKAGLLTKIRTAAARA